MTPGARINAAIEILTALDGPNQPPMDQFLAQWGRRNRYAGSGDRAAIAELVYGAVRRRAQLDWWLAACGHGPDARGRILATLALVRGETPHALKQAFATGRYSPAPLDEAEFDLVHRLSGKALDADGQPAHVRGNLPEWLYRDLADIFGNAVEAELAALMQEAPVDLRVNTLAGSVERAVAALAEDGIDTVPGRLSPLALRLSGRRPLGATAAFKAGLVEVQDEGSQAVAALTDARPGMRVLDLCAGAGGKSLALAAAMENRGRILACDVAGRRLDQAAARLGRASIHIVERRVIADADDPALAEERGGFDRVLVDAPCSGTGTLRRRPDLRWTLTPVTVALETETQTRLLRAAAPLVAPGGRLVYATCSLLCQENETRVEDFLSEQTQFHPLSAPMVWAETLGGACPSTGPFCRLSPGRDGTDGFFVAILERRL